MTIFFECVYNDTASAYVSLNQFYIVFFLILYFASFNYDLHDQKQWISS